MKSLTLAIASLLFISFTVNAQHIKQTPKLKYTKQLCWEFGGDISYTNTTMHYDETGTYNHQSLSTENMFTIEGNAGIFVINGLKLGIEPTVIITSYSGDYHNTQLGLYFAPEYVFNTKSIVYPYIGGAIGYTYAKASYNVGEANKEDGLSYGARAGLKVNFFGNSLLNFGFRFYSENYSYNYSDPFMYYTAKTRYDRVGLVLGWSVFF